MRKLLPFSSVVILLVFGLTNRAISAPVQWTAASGGNDHYYDLIAGPVISWEDAVSASNALGGYLATVTSEEENSFLTSQYATQAWIGGTDEEIEGEWRWKEGPEAGELLTYFKWRLGDPNNGSGIEHYLHWLGDQNGTWVDSSANVGLGTYIVEWGGNPAPVPLPAAFWMFVMGVCGLLGRKHIL